MTDTARIVASLGLGALLAAPVGYIVVGGALSTLKTAVARSQPIQADHVESPTPVERPKPRATIRPTRPTSKPTPIVTPVPSPAVEAPPASEDNTDYDIDARTGVRFQPKHPINIGLGKGSKRYIKYGETVFAPGDEYSRFAKIFGGPNWSDYLFRAYGDLAIALDLDYDNHNKIESIKFFVNNYQGSTTPGGWDFAYSTPEYTLSPPVSSYTAQGVQAVMGPPDWEQHDETWGSGHVRRQIHKLEYRSNGGSTMFWLEDGEVAFIILSKDS